VIYDELVRFAVLGSLPERLRPALAQLPPETAFPVKLPRLRAERTYDDRGMYNPPLRASGGGLPFPRDVMGDAGDPMKAIEAGRAGCADLSLSPSVASAEVVYGFRW
jgi:hypothetical protein